MRFSARDTHRSRGLSPRAIQDVQPARLCFGGAADLHALQEPPRGRCASSGDAPVRARLKELAQERPRFGYRRLGVLLRREGHTINSKGVLRLCREEKLKLRARKRKRVASPWRVQPKQPTATNQMWTTDFMHDTLCGGRGLSGTLKRFRTLPVVDCISREALAVEVATSLTGKRVVRGLQRLLETRGKPEVIQVDNGSEFTGAALE